MKYKVAIFDMDGTILNTIEDLADTMNYALRQYNMPERTLKEITSFVGNGIRMLVERAVPDNTDEDTIEKVFCCFHEYYKDHCAIKTRPYDGVCQVIATLKKKGVRTAVVSNKADYAVKSLCDDYFAGLFEYSVGDKEGQRRKPYPDGVNEVLNYFGVKQNEAVYIGDSEVDYATAQNANLEAIIVGWGFRDEDFLLSLGVKKVIHNPEEIIDIFS